MLYSDYYNENSVLFKGFIVKSFKENSNGDYEAHIELPIKEQICPYCNHKTSYIKDYRIQNIKDLSLIGRPLFIFLRKTRYYCPCCNHSFTESNPLIRRYQHFTDRFYKYIYKELRYKQSYKLVAEKLGVSLTSVIRWFDNISFSKAELPECFSIDEFRGNANNEKFQCNITDPVKHKVLDILPSRRLEELCAHFTKYPLEERLKVKLISMDMSNLFRSAAHILFPNAKIVVDKFHVIRQILWSLENVRKRIQKQFHKDRRKWFKNSKALLLKPSNKLSIEDKLVRNRMLAASYELERAYVLKERFYRLFRNKTKEEAKKYLQSWLLMAANFKIPEFKHCVTTFTRWADEITNIVKYKITNAYTEGVNNKIKVLKRISFGVRNFERFRNRILYLS